MGVRRRKSILICLVTLGLGALLMRTLPGPASLIGAVMIASLPIQVALLTNRLTGCYAYILLYALGIGVVILAGILMTRPVPWAGPVVYGAFLVSAVLCLLVRFRIADDRAVVTRIERGTVMFVFIATYLPVFLLSFLTLHDS